MVFATRLRVGVADSLGGKERLPIFERFYSGGEHSVRGYQRRQLGPTTDSGDPLGGRSLVEAALELRIPVWKKLGLVGFVDAGQVELDTFDLLPDELRFSAGPGVTYETPVGPISLFAGFPINDQPGEPSWQLHLSIGFYF
jgi:outer membrane translocation and assembly module TamA